LKKNGGNWVARELNVGEGMSMDEEMSGLDSGSRKWIRSEWIESLARIVEKGIPAHRETIACLVGNNPYFTFNGSKGFGVRLNDLSDKDKHDLALLEFVRTRYPGLLASVYVQSKWGDAREAERVISEEIGSLPLYVRDSVYREINLRTEDMRIEECPRILDEEVVAYHRGVGIK